MTPPRTVRILAYALAGAAWMGIAYIALAGADPRGACAGYAYRDPVTGRPAAHGPAHVGPDGRVSCPR